jgi:hypothetical protein
VAAAAKAHGASRYGSAVVRLAPLVKKHDLALVAARFPVLLPRDERAYSGTNPPSAYLAAIEGCVARIRATHWFSVDAMRNRVQESEDAMAPSREPVMVPLQMALGW